MYSCALNELSRPTHREKLLKPVSARRSSQIQRAWVDRYEYVHYSSHSLHIYESTALHDVLDHCLGVDHVVVPGNTVLSIQTNKDGGAKHPTSVTPTQWHTVPTTAGRAQLRMSSILRWHGCTQSPQASPSSIEIGTAAPSCETTTRMQNSPREPLSRCSYNYTADFAARNPCAAHTTVTKGKVLESTGERASDPFLELP